LGHPLIAYSIAAGQGARLVTRVLVSTDDERIAAAAREYGAEVPFLRPQELAQDDTQDFPVFRHALTWLSEHEGYRPEIVVQLRPTSPIRPPDCVDRAVEILLEHPEADSVRGIVPAGQNPYKMWRLAEDGRMQPLLESQYAEPYNMPRQMLPQSYWQTGHIDAVRSSTILEKNSLSGDVIMPLLLDARYTVDIDGERDWKRAERQMLEFDVPVVLPGKKRRVFPEPLKLVVLDFDGVLTDNRVWVDADGGEMVAANRSDGWGLARLREAGVDMLVLSTEANPVVAARCAKLQLPVIQGVADKAAELQKLLHERELSPAEVIYLGNDVNDVPCFELVGYALVVDDAHPLAKRAADFVLTRSGGHGAVRELCDFILQRKAESDA